MRNAFVLASVCWLGGFCVSAIGDDRAVGSWRFDGPGSEVADRSGHGHVAMLSGGRVVREGKRDVLALDGRQRITVSPHPELTLGRAFSIEMRVRLDEIGDGHTLVYEHNQFSIRIDWSSEGHRISFFVYVDGQWEPRVTSVVAETGRWYHIVATWNGQTASLWIDGEPFQASHRGSLSTPSGSPLIIASDSPHGAGVHGAIDELRVYRRLLSTSEIIRSAYGIQPERSQARPTAPLFDFTRSAGPLGWTAAVGTTVVSSGGRLAIAAPTSRGLVLQKQLGITVDRRDYVNLRMASDQGSRGELIFVTTRGAGRIPFPTIADGRLHSYVLEPWTWPGWGGTLLALGLVPSESHGVHASLASLSLTAEPEAGPEVHVERIIPSSTLPRAGRSETIVARFRNTGGSARSVQATLETPEGVAVEGPRTNQVSSLGFNEEREVSWSVRAQRPSSGDFRVALSGEVVPATSQRIAFAAPYSGGSASYVPRPIPLNTGMYEVWTHYCPLWKTGTHTGWKLIEGWPERKPVLGWYNEGQPDVADWHIKMMVEHGISGVIYCWYRSNKNAPVTQTLGHAIHDGLLQSRYLPMIKFAIMWENGCGQGCGSADDLLDNLLPFWAENYFSKPSYLMVDGKPALYIWVPQNVTRDLGGSEKVRQSFDRLRAACRARGLGGLYIVGCVEGKDRAAIEQMAREGWDATSAYGNSWQQPATVRTVGDFVAAPIEGFISQQESIWSFKRDLRRLPDIPSAMMGWDSRPWKETAFFWSDNTPEKFRDLCLRLKRSVDSVPNATSRKKRVVFCCWNEFGEGHYIEPTRGAGYAYLDAIRDVFGQGAGEHVDLAPEDVGLGPYDAWYQSARKTVITGSQVPSWSGNALAAWTGMMGIRNLRVENGILRFETTDRDPAILGPTLKIRASRYGKFVVEMRVSRPGMAQVFWTTVSQPATSESASAHAQVPADGRFHRVAFDLGRNEAWGGCVTSLRFDPAAASDTPVEIRSIRLE